ncbi:MAG: hypothetical protein ACK5TN_10310 [Acidobacteriota bacterium]
MRFFSILLAFLVLSSCVSEKEKAPTLPGPRIDRLVPDKVVEGQPFQPQPNGQSALSVLGANLVKGSRIKLNGMPLETASSDGASLAALVPPPLFAKPAGYVVTVETPDGRTSNPLAWIVLAKTGPAPEIRSLHPDTTPAAKPFNVQPNGISAMGIVGINFLPGAKVLLNGKEVETTFGNTDQLGAVIPPEAFAKPGKVSVVILNPDGKRSPAKILNITN